MLRSLLDHLYEIDFDVDLEDKQEMVDNVIEVEEEEVGSEELILPEGLSVNGSELSYINYLKSNTVSLSGSVVQDETFLEETLVQDVHSLSMNLSIQDS